MGEGSMKEVLFICEGNIGRSQMAEGFYKAKRGIDSAISAGIDDIGSMYNHTPREDITEAMKEKGVDISDQRVKQVTEHMLQEAQKVVVLCDPALLPTFVKADNSNVLLRPVDDPFKRDMGGGTGDTG